MKRGLGAEYWGALIPKQYMEEKVPQMEAEQDKIESQ